MNPGKILIADKDGVYLLKLTGDVRVTLCSSISDYIEKIFSGDKPREIYVDLIEAEGLDSTTLGLLTKLALHCRASLGMKPKLMCVNPGILRVLESMALDELFDILMSGDTADLEVREMDTVDADEDQIRQQVLDAHKILVEHNPGLWSEFVDLIATLEEDDSRQGRD